MYHSFRPGKTWYDTQGKRIQAHGGSLLYADGIYYWYGENKEGITGTATGERCPHWHHGVRLYSSVDLYNWRDEGVIMIDREDPHSPFYPANIMDRPHILYNRRTGRYVMWAKCSRKDFGACFFAVCSASDIRGPYTLLPEVDCAPYHAGDFDLVEHGDKAYVIYENPHSEMICQTLTDDYTGLTDEVSSHIPEKCPPFVREAPAYFERGGRKFLLTSGTTGYYPNASRLYEITDFHGEWIDLGDPCEGDAAKNSFHAQFSSVFRHPRIEDLYLALGDRWLTDLPLDLPDMNDLFQRMFDPDAAPLPENFSFSDLSDENTGEAEYVWLPILFREDGTPYLKWRRSWTAEDFCKSR